MNLSPDMLVELERDGPVTIENVNITPRGTQVIFSRTKNLSAFDLPSNTEVRSAFFDNAGQSRYNLIVG